MNIAPVYPAFGAGRGPGFWLNPRNLIASRRKGRRDESVLWRRRLEAENPSPGDRRRSARSCTPAVRRPNPKPTIGPRLHILLASSPAVRAVVTGHEHDFQYYAPPVFSTFAGLPPPPGRAGPPSIQLYP